MGLISWILVGAIAGWLAGKIMKGSGSGLFMNVVIGIIGAFLGGIVMNLIGSVGVTGFNLWSLFVAVIGSILLLGIVSLFQKRRH